MAESAGDLYIDEPLAVVESNKADYTYGGYNYSVSGENATITGYTGEPVDITIPSTIQGYNVTAIGSNAFNNCTTLKSVVIPEGVTTINSSAFNNCTALNSVVIPEGVTIIDASAFASCTKLATVTFPTTLTSLGNSAFRYSGIQKVSLPESLTYLGFGAFSDCISLTSVSFFDTSYANEDTVLSWGASILDGSCAFANCTALTTVALSDYTTTIPENAFTGCTVLKSLTLPDSLTSIETTAFYNCKKLTTVKFPAKLTSIGGEAFRYSGIQKVSLPESLTYLGFGAFSDCASLTSVSFFDTSYANEDTVLSWGGNILYGSRTFANCTALTTVSFSDYTVNIPENAFDGCTGLKAAMLPTSVTQIDKSAFNNCNKYVSTYYLGTASEWENVMVNSGGNSAFINAKVYYNAKNLLNFVERMYTKLLVRKSDVSGKQNHVDSLMRGSTAAEIGAKFVLSTELKNKKLTNREFVKRMYQTFLDRTPSSNEITRWAKTLDNGCTYEYILGRFVASAEFKKLVTNYGITAGTYTPTQNRDQNENVTAFVSRMYTKALKRNYDVTGLNNHTGRILQKTHTPAQIAKLFFFSAELKNKNLSDEEFVTRLYNALFDRNPDATGKANWLTKMKNGYTREKVFDGFAASAEFKNLVASFGL